MIKNITIITLLGFIMYGLIVWSDRKIEANTTYWSNVLQECRDRGHQWDLNGQGECVQAEESIVEIEETPIKKVKEEDIFVPVFKSTVEPMKPKPSVEPKTVPTIVETVKVEVSTTSAKIDTTEVKIEPVTYPEDIINFVTKFTYDYSTPNVLKVNMDIKAYQQTVDGVQYPKCFYLGTEIQRLGGEYNFTTNGERGVVKCELKYHSENRKNYQIYTQEIAF